jgi:Tol biopolymer transport system component
MKRFHQSGASVAAAISISLLFPLFHSQTALAQTQNDDKAERARATAAAKAQNNAQAFEANARTLMIFDRQGKVVSTIGPRDLYNTPVFSPDAKRLAVAKTNLDKENVDMWVIDIASGKAIQLTSCQSREISQTPAWSPDGTRVAYIGLRAGNYGIYQKSSDGQGEEQLLYKLPGIGTLTDWSMDGKYLNFFSTDLGGGTLFALPVNASSGERTPIEVTKSAKQIQGGRFSPDDHFVAYFSNESGKNEIYVRPFDPSGSNGTDKQQWQISDQGGAGMAFWRKDGKELIYLGADRGIMAVSLSTAPAFEAGKPRMLFRPADSIPVAPGTASVSRDAERFVIAVPPPQLRQLTILDRKGQVIKKVGEPGVYGQPGLSPDGSHISATRTDPKTGNLDIWTWDIETGKGYAVTNSVWPDFSPIWSPDGKQVAYVSTREQYSGIYRRAWDGSGEEELLFRYTPGAGVGFSDWSSDGKYLTFSTGVLLIVPLRENEKALDRKAIEWMREEYDVFGGRFSPDMHYLAYASDEVNSQSTDVYIRAFDPGKPDAPPDGQVVRVTKDGARGFTWRRSDGKELYLLTRDWQLMALDVTTSPTLQVGTPKLLFRLPSPLVASSPEGVSRDGERFVFAIPVETSPTR